MLWHKKPRNRHWKTLIPGGESYRYAENLYGLQWWGDECIKPGIDTIYSISRKQAKRNNAHHP